MEKVNQHKSMAMGQSVKQVGGQSQKFAKGGSAKKSGKKK